MSTRALPRVLLAAVVLLQLVAGTVVLTQGATTQGATGPSTRSSAPPASTSTSLPTSDAGAQAGLAPTIDEGARRLGVQLLLDRWSAAVRTANDAALSALFDQQADAGFLGKERARAHNMAEVPFADWGYGLAHEPTPTIPPTVAARVGADELWAPPVTLHYALAGADPVPTTRPVGVVLARRGSVWRLVSDTAVADYGRITWRGPWDFGPVVARSVARGVVLGHPEHTDDVDTLAADVDSAVRDVTDFWGPQWQQRIAVFLPDTQEELKALVGADFSGGEIAAVAIADDVDRGQRTARGQRVVFNPATVGQLTAVSRRVVLRHELTHIAARPVTAPEAPVWLAEGFADYVGYRRSGVSLADGAPAVTALVRRAGPPDSLPNDVQFSSASAPSHVELAYQLAWTFSVFVATVKGEQALRTIYLSLAALPAPSAVDIDRALQPLVGTTLGGLVLEWGRWLQGMLR